MPKCHFLKNLRKFLKKEKKRPIEFYEAISPVNCTPGQKNIQRQAFAGLLWNKQYYHYDVERWLNTGDEITSAVRNPEKRAKS